MQTLVALVTFVVAASAAAFVGDAFSGGAERAQAAAKADETFAIDIALDGHGDRYSTLDGRLHVVLTNRSHRPDRIWRDWCSWGYFCLSFEVRDADGNVAVLRKKPRGWSKNYPDWLSILPGGHYVMAVDLYDARVWERPVATQEQRRANGMSLEIRPVYEVKADDAANEHQVWCGRIVGPWRTVWFF